MADELTGAQQAATLHGLVTNVTVSPRERFALAIQALDLYEAERDALAAQLDEARETQNRVAQFQRARADALAARLAAAEKVVEAAKDFCGEQDCDVGWNRRLYALTVAVDAYRTHEPEPEQP